MFKKLCSVVARMLEVAQNYSKNRAKKGIYLSNVVEVLPSVSAFVVNQNSELQIKSNYTQDTQSHKKIEA